MRESPPQPALVKVDNALEPASSQGGFFGRHHAPDLFHLNGFGASRFHTRRTSLVWPVDAVTEFLPTSVRSVCLIYLPDRAGLPAPDQERPQVRRPGKRQHQRSQ